MRHSHRRSAKADGEARELILDAAEDLIARGGFDATSTSAIAKSADVPKGLLFYYFPSKPEILTALITERLPAERLDANELAVPGDPAASLLATYTRLNLSDHDSGVLRVILWREAETHPHVRSRLRKVQANVEHDIAAVLTACLGGKANRKAIAACASAWAAAVYAFASADRLADLDGLPRQSSARLRDVARMLAAGLGTPLAFA
ncbi:TetR/AcrR family transcriptional regulator [Spelaeicoccus albus]|uniref:AcrR family transcriptional regulator n=1 Tax=Spelaeicoccus albus TaxID=1280376 RepID=A0A7Z0ACD4_9MICO|nr:TetR/AcrR family transcriptional regulator [Spelaeicoccus albus]NYI67340.1 AcrR family transcriptional regulator [Spelaeicoccus albus]